MASSRVVEIPLIGSENVLEIDCSQLPERAFDICEVLEQERSDIKYYLIFALEYYRQNKQDEAIVLLKSGLSKDGTGSGGGSGSVGSMMGMNGENKVPLINCLASIYINKAKRKGGGLLAEYNKPKKNVNASAIGGHNSEGSMGMSGREKENGDIEEELEKRKNEREGYLQLATALFKEAERIQGDNVGTQLGKGIIHLATQQYDLAMQHFNLVLMREPSNVGGLLGKARVMYDKKQYVQALNLYQQVLRIKPNAVKPDVRLGIAMCYYRLGRHEIAKRAIERAISRNPENVAARVVKAVMEFNKAKEYMGDDAVLPSKQGKGEQEIEEIMEGAMEELLAGYNQNSEQAMALILLGERYFYRQEYEKAEELIKQAIVSADTREIQAEAYYQQGRVSHARGKYEEAYKGYQQALTQNPSHGLARLGLGYVQIYGAEIATAVKTFQTVLAEYPGCVEALRMLGYLHNRLPKQQHEAVEYYNRELNTIAGNQVSGRQVDWLCKRGQNNLVSIYDRFSNNEEIESVVQVARIVEKQDKEMAKNYYQAAQEIMDGIKKRGGEEGASGGDGDGSNNGNASIEDNRVELINNVASLGMMIGNPEESIKLLTSVLDGMGDLDSVSGKEKERQITLKYNLARAYEITGQLHKAKVLYEEIANVSGDKYLDAILRLGYIYLYGGLDDDDDDMEERYAKVEECSEKVLAADKKNVSGLLLKAKLYNMRGEAKNVKKTLEYILKQVDRHDIYTLTELGNFYLQAVRTEITALNNIRPVLQNASAGNKDGNANKKDSVATDKREQAKTEYKRHSRDLNIVYKRAHDFFVKCLMLDNTGYMAANGFGCMFAERGYYPQAHDIFTLVNQVVSSLSSSTSNTNQCGLGIGVDVELYSSINLAHVLVELGNYRSATSLYESIVKRLAYLTSNDDKSTSNSKIEAEAKKKTKTKTNYETLLLNTQLALARSLYIHARVTKSIPVMHQALNILLSLCDFDAIISSLTDDSDADTAADADADADTNTNTNTEKGNDSTNNSNIDKKPECFTIDSAKNTVLMYNADPIVLYNIALVKQNLAQLFCDYPSDKHVAIDELQLCLTGLEHSNLIFTKLSQAKQLLAETAASSAITNLHKLLHYDPKLSAQRASFGKYLVGSLGKKIAKVQAETEQRKILLMESKKRRMESVAKMEEQQRKLLEEQQKSDMLLLEQQDLINLRLRQELLAAPTVTSTPSATSTNKKSTTKRSNINSYASASSSPPRSPYPSHFSSPPSSPHRQRTPHKSILSESEDENNTFIEAERNNNTSSSNKKRKLSRKKHIPGSSSSKAKRVQKSKSNFPKESGSSSDLSDILSSELGQYSSSLSDIN